MVIVTILCISFVIFLYFKICTSVLGKNMSGLINYYEINFITMFEANDSKIPEYSQ